MSRKIYLSMIFKPFDWNINLFVGRNNRRAGKKKDKSNEDIEESWLDKY